MTIRAEVEGVGTLEFPDDTPADVIQRTVQRVVGEQKPDFLPGAAQKAMQGGTFGGADEAQAAIGATYAKLFGGKATADTSWRDLYKQGRDELRADDAAFGKAYPKSSLGLEIAGGIATGGGLAKLAGRAAPTSAVGKLAASAKALPASKQAVAAGTAGGALAGAGYSDADSIGGVAADTALGAGMGAAAGVIAPAVARNVTNTFRRIVGSPKIQVFDDAGQFTQDAMNRLDEMVKSGKVSADDAQAIIRENLAKEGVLTPEQAQRFNLFQRRGVAPVRADVTQATSDFLEKQSALKRTGPVSAAVAQQDEQIANVVNQSIDSVGAAASNPLETSRAAYGVVDSVASKLDEAVGQAYASAREASRGQPFVKLSNFARAVSDNRGAEQATGGVASFARGLLENKGLVKAGNRLDINKRGRRATGDALKKLTVNEAEEIRQGLNSIYDSVTPAGRRMIRELKDAIDDDVAEVIGEDLFADARAAKSLFHTTIEKARRSKFDKSRGSFLEDVLYNKIPEEKIYTRLMTARDDDFLKFKQFMIESGPEGDQAWKNIKAQVMRDAFDKATGTMGKGEGGRPIWNARSFRNAFNGIRNTKKYAELFNADERALIDDIVEIGRLRVPPSLVQQGAGPTEVAVDRLRTKILKLVPFVGDGAQEIFDTLATRKTDMRILNPARETAKAISAGTR